MSSTEAKHLLHAAHAIARNGGIAGIVADMRCLDVPVLGGGPLFPDVIRTNNARESAPDDCRGYVRGLSRTLEGAGAHERLSAAYLIGGTSKRSYYGNQAVCGLAALIFKGKTGCIFEASAAFKHAEENENGFLSLCCHGSNLNPQAAVGSQRYVAGKRAEHRAEHAADAIKQLWTLGNSKSGKRRQGRFVKATSGLEAKRHLARSENPKQVHEGTIRYKGAQTRFVDIVHENLEHLRVRSSSVKDHKASPSYSRTYVAGDAFYWVCRPKKDASDPPKPTGVTRRGTPIIDAGDAHRKAGEASEQVRGLGAAFVQKRRAAAAKKSELLDGGLTSKSHTEHASCYTLFGRDRRDLDYILNAADLFLTHRRSRLLEYEEGPTRELYEEVTRKIFEKWVEIMELAGKDVFLASNVGTLMDQVTWVCLAHMAGKRYFDHVKHMEEKARRKVGKYAGHVFELVYQFGRLPIDARVDLFGVNKMSIYPQICAYNTVLEQLEKHCEPWDCQFDDMTPLDLRRSAERREMFVYMRYFYIRIFQASHKYCPGTIKPGVEPKPWHHAYRAKGIPSNSWREASDVDLTGTSPIGKPDMDTYLTLADRACAPANPACYTSMDAYVRSPSYEKRKLLYFLQHPRPQDIATAHAEFQRVGNSIGTCDVAHRAINVDFSLDISTGIRFERQKPAGRPFYQVCAPLGCLISNCEQAVRMLLKKVPQSLMSMSLKDRSETALRINALGQDVQSRFMVSDDKEAYSPHMDPESQQMTADFFAEVTNDSTFKSAINVLTTNELYYRVHDRLVHYPSNGTDREGLRGAQNTWLEIVCHGYHTRCIREKGLYQGTTSFIGFIDDALRRYQKEISAERPTVDRVKEIIADLEEKLRIVGRKLSWDKAYVSETLSTILGEIFYWGLPMANGLKAFLSFADVEEKLVEDLGSHEGNFASKAIGAKVANASDVAATYQYIHQTMKQHYRFGVRTGPTMSPLEYQVWCMTPLAFGGAGMRGPIELNDTETGDRTTGGIGNLIRLCAAEPQFTGPIDAVLNHPLELLSPMDFLRNPLQVRVEGPRIKTQRVAQYVRAHLRSFATSPVFAPLFREEDEKADRLEQTVKEYMNFTKIDLQEVKNYYSNSVHEQLDSLVTKICTSDTVKSLIQAPDVGKLRRAVRKDARWCSLAFRYRLLAEKIPDFDRK